MTSDRLLAVLRHHVGITRGIGVADLARLLGVPERRVRKLVSECREDGVAIGAHPTTGYYIAETPEELEHCCRFLRSRALHSLRLEAQLRRIPLQDLIGQLRLKT